MHPSRPRRALGAVLLPLFAFLILAGAPAPTAAENYQWTLSASETDPWVNTAVPTDIIFEVHLWLVCSASGMSGASFDLAAESFTVLTFVSCCGFVEIPDPDGCPVIGVDGCPVAPLRAGYFLILDDTLDGGRLGLQACATDGRNVTFDCESPPNAHDNAWVGFASDGTDPPSSGFCGTVGTDGATWGRVKSLYR